MIKSNDEMTRRLLEIRNDLTEIQAEIFYAEVLLRIGKSDQLRVLVLRMYLQ
jgi:hypothetical protein